MRSANPLQISLQLTSDVPGAVSDAIVLVSRRRRFGVFNGLVISSSSVSYSSSSSSTLARLFGARLTGEGSRAVDEVFGVLGSSDSKGSLLAVRCWGGGLGTDFLGEDNSTTLFKKLSRLVALLPNGVFSGEVGMMATSFSKLVTRFERS